MAQLEIKVKSNLTFWYYVAKFLVFTGLIKIKKVYYWICRYPLIIMQVGNRKSYIFFND